MTDVIPPTRFSGKAVVSVFLGVLSFGLSLAAGLPALLLGLHSLREINGSEGRLKGRRLAVAGMVLGSLGTLATLIGMLTVVLTRLQMPSQVAGCQNNLRQIGEALNQYENEYKAYPTGTWPNAGLVPNRRLSWYVSILPYLPDNTSGRVSKTKTLLPLFREIDKDAAWDADVNAQAVRTAISWFICPANTYHTAPDSPRLTTYVGIAGIGKDAAELPEKSRNAGVFGYDRQTSRQAVLQGRGTSQTMMVAETALDNGPWAAGGSATVRGLNPALQPYIGPGHQFGGLHLDGLNLLFVDGSVRFIRDSIKPEVFEAHATVAGDQP